MRIPPLFAPLRALLFLGLCITLPLSSPAQGNELLAQSSPTDTPTNLPLSAEIALPANTTFYLHSSATNWTSYSGFEFGLFWPVDAPASNVQVLVHMKDWDFFWFQNLLPGSLIPGITNRFKVDLSPQSNAWRPVGHKGVWNYRSLMKPAEFAIRIFGSPEYKGSCTLDFITPIPRITPIDPPRIRNLRTNTNSLPCYTKFEISLQLPDRYTDPFDDNQIRLVAEFISPSGRKHQVEGFYNQDFYHKIDVITDVITPQGAPYWQIRFSPAERGTYTYTITATDSAGSDNWGPGSFVATEPTKPGFLRVSRRDPRFFEFDNRTFFFPIGHNIRSPFDTRMNQQFPWAQRWPEGSSAYARYFKNMRESGQNFAEIWSASWSLGLEWNNSWYGYHGVGQYNMIHAWETDRVLEMAEENSIYINLVIHNHGKFSSYSDPEWTSNPFLDKNGGFLEYPEQFFTDERAKKAFLKLMRYMMARWGYSTHLFAWQLWSELDLTGSQKPGGPSHRRPEVVEWHKLMGKTMKEMDPYDHLISTHVCGDYGHQNPAIISLEEIDHCPVDAYHSAENPLHIVELLRKTAEFNNPYKKPVLVTEFGGTSGAQGLTYLDVSLHSALWASTCVPISGTPLFWWWQLLEEENMYPKYKTIANFMQGEDRRFPDMLPAKVGLEQESNPSLSFSACSMQNRDRANGWIYFSESSWIRELPASASPTNLFLLVDNMDDGVFEVEYWNTMKGEPMVKTSFMTNKGMLELPVPPFYRDIAFKIRKKTHADKSTLPPK